MQLNTVVKVLFISTDLLMDPQNPTLGLQLPLQTIYSSVSQKANGSLTLRGNYQHKIRVVT